MSSKQDDGCFGLPRDKPSVCPEDLLPYSFNPSRSGNETDFAWQSHHRSEYNLAGALFTGAEGLAAET
ncbi:hypothetical protein WJX75_002068 [Coccomyxa subellipsoidea]|uniref:Uncharacterized protein n=1 Tax=Coccomyxa subellipsoidea TaxID=248742 RepID=A0ABR2YAG6_9CHLO